ncbi:hypothetical protein F2Q70_00028411 [Brassica cretica]|uniref:Uncharacterized protein n=1 Tax=Brassica cretica TaxID=69181 RepID=A0A8S9LBQ5_BRACR|nr:hypothetical protein F2Q70_00028411 [Brassica cretica]
MLAIAFLRDSTCSSALDLYSSHQKEEHLPTTSRAQQPARPHVPHKAATATDKSPKEKISTSSPEHVRERPFKLTLQKRSTEDQRLKGKASDSGNISDEGSSAKKSLKFDEEKPPPISKSQAAVPVLSFLKEKEKSWYEQTLEEEETMDKEILNKPDKPMEKERRRILMQKNSRGFLLISPWRNHTSCFVEVIDRFINHQAEAPIVSLHRAIALVQLGGVNELQMSVLLNRVNVLLADIHYILTMMLEQPARPHVPHKAATATDKSQKKKISTSSPEHVRERPFKLTLQKRSTEDQKLKGKASDSGNISDEGSSAKKSLKFDEEKPPPISKSQAAVLVLSFVKDKEKSWYEQTLEEEETMDKEILNKPDKPMEKERRRILMQKNSRGFLLISPWRNHTSWLWNGNL